MSYQPKKGRVSPVRVAVFGVLAAATIGAGYWHVTTAGHASPTRPAPAPATVGAPATTSPAASSTTAAPAATSSAPAVQVAAPAAASTTHRATPAPSRPAAPTPVRVTHPTPAVVPPAGQVDDTPVMCTDPVDCPSPYTCSQAGEDYDGVQCVQPQNPNEAIGGYRCGDDTHVVVAINPDGSYRCGLPTP